MGVAALIAFIAGCSPIYTFRGPSDANDITPLRQHLATFLQAQGFQRSGYILRASGPIGCGMSATDHALFERESHVGPGYAWVWVHDFMCDDGWHFIIVSSNAYGAEREAAQLRDALRAEFSGEIASGALRVKTHYRMALE